MSRPVGLFAVQFGLVISLVLLLSPTAKCSPSPTPRPTPPPGSPNWPIKTATTGRYLVDSSNTPFFLWCDTTWNLFTAVPLTGSNSASTYFADRLSRGFKAVYCPLFSGPGTTSTSRANLTTHDGIAPFTRGSATGDGAKNNYDISTPNSAYFQRIVDMVNLAYSNGLAVVLNVYENYGWEINFKHAGTAKVQALGATIGNWFKNCPNIIYNYGDDYQDWQTNSASEAAVAALEAGIKSTDPNHIHLGIELNFNNSTSFDDIKWTVLDANDVYTYYPSYVECYHGYSQSTKPIFLIECNYEAENYGGPPYYVDDGGPTPSGTFSTAGSAVIRRQIFWGLTSGLAGFNYGNWWTADNTSTSSSWARNLSAPAGNSGCTLVRILTARNWWKLVPDIGHRWVTAGYGKQLGYPGIIVGEQPAPNNPRGSVPADTYCSAALASDGSFGLVYVPQTATITVELGRLSGNVTAHWVDPVSGAMTTISGSPFANSGSRKFTSPGTNGDRTSTDWLLILDGDTGRLHPSDR